MNTTDPRLRAATSIEMSMALRKLFSVLPPRGASSKGDEDAVAAAMDGQLEGYLIAIEGSSHHALGLSINRIIRGEIDGISKKFCPTAPELSSIIRGEMEFVRKQIALAEERLQIADNRPVVKPALLLQDRIAAARQKMADEERKFLFATDSHAGVGTRRRDMPAGSIYVGILGEFYGPAGSARRVEVTQEMLRADMFEPEPETPVDDVPDMPPLAPVEAYEDVEF